MSDVPPKLPIIRTGKTVLKYQGVYFDKANNKRRASINIGGKNKHVGNYDTEEVAAVDYARAKFKYKEDHLPLPVEQRQSRAISCAIISEQAPHTIDKQTRKIR